MALINCPECSKEISSTADACPNCGHPINKVPTRTVDTVVLEKRQESFPKWIIIPIAILGTFLIFGLIYMLQNNETADQQNINVNVDTQREVTEQTQDIPVRQTDTDADNMTDTTIPPTTNDQIIGTDTRTNVDETNIDSGKVELEAKVSDSKGNIKPVNAEKFYLLDKELETILREANLESVQNQNLVNSFGLSVLYPNKYREFNQKALSAINDHIKYDTLTDSTGKAQIGNVKPDSYYLFGIHKVGNGFAIWSSPVNIKGGTNNLNIQPQRPMEFPQ